MFFALSFIIVLAALYFLVYGGFDSNSVNRDFEDFKTTIKNPENITQTSAPFDFDFETLVTPDELSILISKK